MNLIGKIFVVLIFVMSIVFMAFAMSVVATHQNWKKVAEDTGKQLNTTRQQVTEAQENLDKLKSEMEREQTAKREALAKLETERTELQQQRDALVSERDELMEKDKTTVAALHAAEQNLTRLTSEVEGLRGEIRTAQSQRDQQFDQVVKLTDQTHQAQGELERLQERQLQLAEQLASAGRVLEANNLTKDMSVDGQPPLVRGKVLAISQGDMLEVSLGRDDGLRVGHTLEIFRGSKYLGRVEIMHADTDRAVARIIPGFKKGPIQKGDDVATRFKA